MVESIIRREALRRIAGLSLTGLTLSACRRSQPTKQEAGEMHFEYIYHRQSTANFLIDEASAPIRAATGSAIKDLTQLFGSDFKKTITVTFRQPNPIYTLSIGTRRPHLYQRFFMLHPPTVFFQAVDYSGAFGINPDRSIAAFPGQKPTVLYPGRIITYDKHPEMMVGLLGYTPPDHFHKSSATSLVLSPSFPFTGIIAHFPKVFDYVHYVTA